MSVYAQLNETRDEVLIYPLSIHQIRFQFPDKSWPNEPDQESLDYYNLVEITLVAPPESLGKQYQIIEINPSLVNGAWTQTWQQSILDTLDELKEKELLKLAEYRYNIETGGVIWNTFPVNSDRDSQAKLTALYIMAINNLWPGGYWKFADGISRVLTISEAINLSLTVGNHVATAFNREAEIADEIRLATTPEDVTSWTW